MKPIAFALFLVLACAAPAAAALKPGSPAPDFSASGYLAGAPIHFRLSEALKKGPVVLYFFPAAYTKGCNLEARQFSEAAGAFKAYGASIVGVTAGKTHTLAAFSKDTKTCSGKFPVLADPGLGIAKRYDAVFAPLAPVSNRTSYVIAPNGKILHVYSALAPDAHVDETLGAVKALRATKSK